MKSGQFIVVEGLEGAGKTTAIKTIKRLLNEQQTDFITTREPGGTFVGESLRTIIKESPVEEPLDPRSELLLFYAARVQLLEQVIKPALQQGRWVLADRFELSSFAYQGGGRKISQDFINSLSLFCVEDCRPDWIVFLDIKPEQGLERALQRGKLDRIEQESLNFFHDVYDQYHQQIQRLNNVILIDASQPLAAVQNDIRARLNHALSFDI